MIGGRSGEEGQTGSDAYRSAATTAGTDDGDVREVKWVGVVGDKGSGVYECWLSSAPAV